MTRAAELKFGPTRFTRAAELKFGPTRFTSGYV